MIWFTADYHLAHKNIIEYCNRPFSSVKEMDQTILNNLSLVIKPGDDIYYLGDLSFNTESARIFLDITKRCNVIFIKGNHDKGSVIHELKQYKIPVYGLKTITFDKQVIVLCHYAMRVWDRSHYNSWQLYAHSHGSLPPIGKQHDVGVDNNDFKPVSMSSLFEIMNQKPNNFNYIRGI